MFAAFLHGSSLQIRERPVPRLRPGWALVQVCLAGICNTDLEILRGYHNFHGVLGHEFVGEVVRCSLPRAGATRNLRRWIGRRVVGEINISCRGLGRRALCENCRHGAPTHCENRRVLGILAHHGAFAEYLALPLKNLHHVPDCVPDEAAVFTEPLAAACEILEQVELRGCREAAVLGDGKLAQLIARVLATAGLRVVMYGRHTNKLALARSVRIETRRASLASSTSRRERYRLVVEATGAAEGLAQAVAMTAPRGTLVLKSTFHGAARFETWPIVVNEITVVGSRCGPFPRALELLASGRVDPRPLISRVFPLREAPAAIRAASKPDVLKVLLKM